MFSYDDKANIFDEKLIYLLESERIKFHGFT